MSKPIIAVDVPQLGDERRRHWAKVVTFVDVSKTNGWAFEGDFIADGGVQDVESGSVILVYGERGSRGNPHSLAAVFIANPDGTLSRHLEAEGRAWARTLRDEVAELLLQDAPIQAKPWDPALLSYDDAAILEEVRRRGLDQP
ncbi:MAG: hypothetical protein KJP12_02445 [Acidimicrobiia bacterium]|nr:hypothetical protein [Acidimicrobiia bacterium]MBT8214055.1 hypothetical protein [Acidimicrobiia bacterium]NNF69660.1 hypothetical protein [Acidimicrobiia bacterium]